MNSRIHIPRAVRGLRLLAATGASLVPAFCGAVSTAADTASPALNQDASQAILQELREIRRMPAVRAICLYRTDEGSTSVCPDLKNTTVLLRELPGDPRFNNDYARVADAALAGMAKF
jgi:type IV secretory pathway VirJ component